jgi:hypothetical protein
LYIKTGQEDNVRLLHALSFTLFTTLDPALAMPLGGPFWLGCQIATLTFYYTQI